MKVAKAVYLITGGSSGLGAATARRLHAAGASVVICNRDVTAGKVIASELGNDARFVRTDVVEERDAANAVEVAVTEFGSLHGLVNCAGMGWAEHVIGEHGPHGLSSFTTCLQVNLVGTFNMVRFAALAMSRNEPSPTGERGVIVNTASIVGYEGQAGHAAYAASYAGVIGMTLPLARELARSGIRVMTIAPGPFLTPRLDSFPPAVLEALSEGIPFPRRLGHPDEYARLVQHIVENEMLNGETIRIDGATRFSAADPTVRVG